jgi:hypothetical protein
VCPWWDARSGVKMVVVVAFVDVVVSMVL